MSKPALRIATRASRLALWQAHYVADLLKNKQPDLEVEIVHISTVGDRVQTESLASMGGQGVFTREVQKALLDDRADLAVHSLKDLPTESAAKELHLAAISEREVTTDALVLPEGSELLADLMQLPSGLKVGTGSLRRQAQLLNARSDLQVSPIRGNVETRLRKLDEGEYDAIILASAGLTRLELAGRISQELSPPVMFPAVGQGALGIECRVEDETTNEILALLNDLETAAATKAERALLHELQAGCHAPVGAATQVSEGELRLEGVVLSADGKERVVAQGSAAISEADQLGREVARQLVEKGAEPLVRAMD